MPETYHKIVHDTYSIFAGEADDHADDHERSDHGAGQTEEQVAVSSSPASGSVADDGHDGSVGHNASNDDSHDAADGDAHGGGHSGLHHFLSLHFIINDLFMVLFFGIAAKEIAEACLPGGALNPVSKAINPLLGTLGGVVGPVAVYFLLNLQIGEEAWARGWGIPTATDIALAWLIARLVFGNGHPAISFLLLLAVADDGIGLMIIAIFYPTQDPVWINALFIVPGMVVAYVLRKKNVQSWLPYIVIGGAFSWWGLFSAHLHPALALVPIVPFLPGPDRDEGMFRDDVRTKEIDPLNNFEHDLKGFVDFGLFFFAFANAGVQFSNISNLTWIVFLALLVGKTVGITFFSWVGTLLNCPLPSGMKMKHLVVAGVVAGLGLTVALFVSGQAFKNLELQGAAKMGALFSGGIAGLALLLGKVLGVKDGAGVGGLPQRRSE
ncbi:MAG: sodium:proton antiporter [Pirellulaceae bacterium]|nr:sodium:proton antiporter [Pirellulaceae bacterium]